MSEQRIALHSRKKTNRKYWYAQFKDEETGLYGTARSIDVLSRKLGDKPHHISKSDEAYRVAERALKHGLAGKQSIEDQLFITYLTTFWDYDNSPYIRVKNRSTVNQNGWKSINRDYVYNMASCIKNHVAHIYAKT